MKIAAKPHKKITPIISSETKSSESIIEKNPMTNKIMPTTSGPFLFEF